MSGRPKTEHAPVEALVALASRDGLGDQVVWDDVRALILALERSPTGMSDARRIHPKINDPEVVRTIADWLLRVAEDRDADAEDASRAGEKLLAPVQIVSLGGIATCLFAASTGAIGAATFTPLFLGVSVVAMAAAYGRWRLSKRDDAARRDARALRRMALVFTAEEA